jgi:signal transduction histidine kinase
LLLAEDVTEKRGAEPRLRAQHATTQALAGSSSVAAAVPAIFRAICENLGCDWGELWRVEMAVPALCCTQVWHPAAQPLPELERATRNVALARGEGIPGTVWLRNRPIWISDLAESPRFQRARIMTKHGLRAGFAFPIGLDREVLGVIAVFRREVLPLDKHLLGMLRDICSQIGQMMGRRRAERRLLEISEREQQRIGQDLHDGLCQQLTGISYMASTLESSLAKKSLPEAKAIARIARLSRETAVQARQVACGLNPVKVGKIGLVAALDELASSIQLMFSISCQFKCQHRVTVADHETAVHLYRIAQEAIHNAIIHGKASQIVVSLERATEGVVLSVKDNGSGLFKASRNGSGMGLENMSYRARAIGARLEFKRHNPGGTTMNCTVLSREGMPA